MTKFEFEAEIRHSLRNIDVKEVAALLEYYEELFYDRYDLGYREDEIIKGFGSPLDIAEKFLSEYQEEREKEYAQRDYHSDPYELNKERYRTDSKETYTATRPEDAEAKKSTTTFEKRLSESQRRFLSENRNRSSRRTPDYERRVEDRAPQYSRPSSESDDRRAPYVAPESRYEREKKYHGPTPDEVSARHSNSYEEYEKYGTPEKEIERVPYRSSSKNEETPRYLSKSELRRIERIRIQNLDVAKRGTKRSAGTIFGIILLDIFLFGLIVLSCFGIVMLSIESINLASLVNIDGFGWTSSLVALAEILFVIFVIIALIYFITVFIKWIYRVSSPRKRKKSLNK